MPWAKRRRRPAYRYFFGKREGTGMKKSTLLVAVVSLFLPAVKIYIHSQLGAETAALYPQTISLWDTMTRKAAGLPVDQVPALELIRLDGWMLLAGIGLMALGAALPLTGKRGCIHAAIVSTGMALGLMPSNTG